MKRDLLSAAFLASFGSGCSAMPAALDPSGPGARSIADLFWVFLIISTVVFALVLIALGVALVRGARGAHRPADVPPGETVPAVETNLRRGVVGAFATTAITLFGLLVTSVATGKVLSNMDRKDALVIEVVGHQWWWQVTYVDPVASHRVVTANEIHIPVARPVILRLQAADVIHSFWVPSLHGKKDLIPGHTNELLLKADRPGLHRGQCAEFCGVQHAQMAIYVISEEKGEFESWLDRQRAPATPPETAAEKRGLDVFLRGTCAMCHSIAGTDAGATTGPDLTHVKSRRALAANTIDNDRPHLTAWILDPVAIKPGTQMPEHPFSKDDLTDLVSYLETLR
jgi:cytochrome c oxidase subunit II